MPRISKAVEIERRMNLVEAAERLFLLHGYENTTVNDIVDKLNLAKGTFYYHFRSKEAILVAVSEKLLTETHNDLKRLHEEKNKNVLERLKSMLDLIDQGFYRNEKIWRFVYHENNVTLHYQIIKTCKQELCPLIADVLEEASKNGLLEVAHPSEMAEALVILIDLYAKQICSENETQNRVSIQHTIKQIMESILNKKCVPDFGITNAKSI